MAGGCRRAKWCSPVPSAQSRGIRSSAFAQKTPGALRGGCWAHRIVCRRVAGASTGASAGGRIGGLFNNLCRAPLPRLAPSLLHLAQQRIIYRLSAAWAASIAAPGMARRGAGGATAPAYGRTIAGAGALWRHCAACSRGDIAYARRCAGS